MPPPVTNGKIQNAFVGVAETFSHFLARGRKEKHTHMEKNKNAYEIRLDVLDMAHNAMMNQYHQKLDAHRDCANRDNKSFDVELIETLKPKTQDIVAYANELYAFVEGK